MTRERLYSKIHRCVVTKGDIDYIGSITIPHKLREAADLNVGDKVDIVSIDNGARLTTYVIAPDENDNSNDISINGAAAHLIDSGLIIIISYASMTEEEAKNFTPKVVFTNAKNEIVSEQEALIGGSFIEKMARTN
jgi:aspartate 1-decarboxylase